MVLPLIIFVVGTAIGKVAIAHGITGLVLTLGGKAVAAKAAAVVGSTVASKAAIIAAAL